MILTNGQVPSCIWHRRLFIFEYPKVINFLIVMMKLFSLVIAFFQKPFPLTGELRFLVGTWAWEKTKFLDRIIPSIRTHYKTPQTEGCHYGIIFSEHGKVELFRNGRRIETQTILDIKVYNNNLHSDGVLDIEVFTNKTGRKKGRRFQKLYNYSTINALYTFPFSKAEGASYNWFNKLT